MADGKLALSLASGAGGPEAWVATVLPREIGATLADHRLGLRTVVLCAAIAVASHAVIGLAFNVWGVRDTGEIAVPTDAISLELVATDVVEQAARPETRAAAASAAAVAPMVGSAAESAAASTTPEPEKPYTDPAEPPVATHAETPHPDEPPTTAHDELVSAPVVSAGAEKGPVDKPRVKQHESERRAEKKREMETKAKQSQKQGGARSRGETDNKSAPARVSGSAGDIAGYAARVRARVAANRPAGGGLRGTAVVSFGVSKGGGLAYARIARSSGNARLDQAAISAVRRSAPFPHPPAGASSGQLRFSTPFYFR